MATKAEEKLPACGPWTWFVEKVLPGLFVAITLSVVATSVAIWKSVAEITGSLRNHEAQIQDLRQEVKVVREQAVMRSELLETLKRVEQQLQIALLEARLNSKNQIKLTR
jgi:cell shape-determining protein MreC